MYEMLKNFFYAILDSSIFEIIFTCILDTQNDQKFVIYWKYVI